MRTVRELVPWPQSGLWRHGDFLRLWSAQTISEFGSQITLLALPLAAIFVLHATAFEVAVLSTIEFVPFKHREPGQSRPESDEQKSALRRELRRGARYVLRNPFLRAVMLSAALANFGFNLIWAIVLVYAVRTLDLRAGIIGALLSLGQVGGLLGAIFGNRIARTVGVGRTMIGAAAFFGPSSLALAAAPRSMPIPFLVFGWGTGSFVSVIYSVMGSSIRQAIVPQRLQGRVVGFNRFVIWGVIPFGSLTGGALAATIGLRPAILIGAIVAFCAFLPLLLSPLRMLRELPATAEEPDAASPPEESVG